MNQRNKKIGFIGQGWIGKHYADDFKRRGFEVVRYSLEGPHIHNSDNIKNCDIVFIAVPTPSTPAGFDDSVLRQVIKMVAPGRTAVIKSTLLPGTTEKIQQENPDIFVFHSPEFLTESSAAYDAANPIRNIIGFSIDNQEYRQRAREILDVLPKASYQLICPAREAELIKYGGNNWFYFKVVFVNMLYDLASRMNCRWETIRDAMAADPRIGSSHLNPVHRSGEPGGEAKPRFNFNDFHLEPIHKGGRGAGGHCFIKDFAAFHRLYNEVVGDPLGHSVLESIKNKNIDLLVSTNKDLDLLSGVYGQEAVSDRLGGNLFDKEEVSRPKRKTRCLVTGGAGFIGSNLVDELIARGNEVIVIDNLLLGSRENVHPEAKFYELDIRDLAKIKPLFEGVDYVFHVAARPRVQPSIIDPVTAHDINVNGTLNVLIAARDAKVKKFIYSSSSSIYGNQEQMPLREDMPPNPVSPYALQKYIAERYCQLFTQIYGLPTTCLRYFSVYGQRQRLDGAYCLVLGIFVKQRLNGESMTIRGTGENRRGFTSVVDVVRANILAANSLNVGQGEVINIGRDRSYSVNEIARMIGGPVVYVPSVVEPHETLADYSRARELLGWEPTVELSDWLQEYKRELGLR